MSIALSQGTIDKINIIKETSQECDERGRHIEQILNASNEENYLGYFFDQIKDMSYRYLLK